MSWGRVELPFRVIALLLLLAGCGMRPPASGVEPGGRGRWPAVGLVPLLRDEVRMVRDTGWTVEIEDLPLPASGWNTPRLAARIAGEVLAERGTAVLPVSGLPVTALGSAGGEGWPQAVWRALRDAGRLPEAPVVLLLRQNAVSHLGVQYSPVRDYLLLGTVGLVAGALSRERIYTPSFVLSLQSGLSARADGMGGFCFIGFDAVLLDSSTGAELGAARNLPGQQPLPKGVVLHARWAELDAEERQAAATYCTAALRRGIEAAIRETGLVVRP